jgi:uncharacterized phage protein gp47/JayE
MAFDRPTLAEIVDRIENDFISRLDLSGAVLRRSMVAVLSRVLAGAAHMLHGHLDYLSKQLFPDESEADFLARQGSLFGVTKNPATFATGTVTLTGTNGVVVPAATVLLRSDGQEYKTAADVTIASGTATASVTASLAGSVGTLTTGVVLTLESPISGVTASATVATSTVDGTDQESDDDYRARVLDRMRSPPHGGASADYLAWAREVSGVTRAWVYPLGLGVGTVLVRFMRDNDLDPIPDSGEVAAVQTYINTLRPVTATVTVSAPTAAPLAFNIHLVPDTTATRAAVTAELTDLLRRDAAPGSTILISAIRTAIGSANGVTDYTLSSPASDVTHTAGQIATMGAITWS